MYSFPSLSSLQQRIKVIKEKNNILSKKFKRSRFNESQGKVVNNHLQNETKCDFLNEDEISSVENCYVKAIKLVEHYQQVKKEQLSCKRINIEKNLNSENFKSNKEKKSCVDYLRKKCFSKNDKIISKSDKDILKSDLPCNSEFVEKKEYLNIHQERSKKSRDIMGISDKHASLPSSSKLIEENHLLKNIQFSCQENNFLKNSLKHKDRQCFFKNERKNKNSIFENSIEKDTVVIALSDEDDNLPSSLKLDETTVTMFKNNEDVVYLKNVNNLNENYTVQAKRNDFGCASKRKKSKKREKFQDEIKRKDTTINFNKKANKKLFAQNSNNVNLKTFNTCNKIITISDEIYNTSLDTTNQKFNFTEKNASQRSFKDFECEILVNDTVENKNFQNNSGKLIKVFDVTKDIHELMVPGINLKDKPVKVPSDVYLRREKNEFQVTEVDLTEDIARDNVQEVELIEEMAGIKVQVIDLTEDLTRDKVLDIDLTEEPDEVVLSDLDIQPHEVIVQNLDLTEEPVDFNVPRLHLDEFLREIPDDEIKSLKLEGVNIRSGKWLKEEIKLLQRNFRDFQSQFGVYDARLLLGIGRYLPFLKYNSKNIKKFLKVKHFNVRLGKDINERTLYSIYRKARIIFNPLRTLKQCGASDISSILKLQKKYGNNWNLIGQILGIQSEVCYILFIRFKKSFSKGSWSDSEIKNLISAVQFVKSSDLRAANISWGKVAALVSTRNSTQCQSKWKKIKNKNYVKNML